MSDFKKLTKKEKIRRLAKKEGLSGDLLDQFLAQVAVESKYGERMEEDPRFRISKMRELFDNVKGMTDEELKDISPKYKGTKEKLFNTIYSNRADLGTGEGEGNKYRGRGLVQFTGKSNYKKYGLDSDEARKKLESTRDEDLPFNVKKAVEYFKDITKDMKEPTTDDITRKINKKTDSYAKRRREYKKLKDLRDFTENNPTDTEQLLDKSKIGSGHMPESLDFMNPEKELKRLESLRIPKETELLDEYDNLEMPTTEEMEAEREARAGSAYADGTKFLSTPSFVESGSELSDDQGVQIPDTSYEQSLADMRDPFAPKSEEAIEAKEDIELAAEEDKTMVDNDPDTLPEEPESKPEPLTMETLEQRFQDLMKASKKERQTAAWATAASQIASMIDRASGNPIGIKPINFQAGDASAEAKDLLALGKLKGLGVNGRMTPAQQLNYQLSKERLAETKEDRARKARQFKDSLTRREREDLDKKVAKIGDNLEKQGLIGRTRAMKEIESYLSDAYDTTLDDRDNVPDIEGIGVMGGFRPDALTDSGDVSFRQNIQSLANQLLKARSGAAVTDQEYRRFLREVGSGNFSTEKDLFQGLRKMREDIKMQTRNAAKVYGEDTFNLYKERTGVELYDETTPQKKQSKKITEDDIDNMSIEELRREGLIK